jgi:ubiquinone/menaquinone biosynthesis C-methylase UbiE
VHDVTEKEDCLKEAIRVLRPDGHFVFLDLFDDPKYYPMRSKYKEVIAQHGARIDEDKTLHEIIELPFPLNGKRSLKYARIVSGLKGSTTPNSAKVS